MSRCRCKKYSYKVLNNITNHILSQQIPFTKETLIETALSKPELQGFDKKMLQTAIAGAFDIMKFNGQIIPCPNTKTYTTTTNVSSLNQLDVFHEVTA